MSAPPHAFFVVSALFHYLGPAFAVLLGVLFAFANCVMFVLYVVLGHRIARDGGRSGIDHLGAAMWIAVAAITPFGIAGAAPAFRDPHLLAAGIGVGVCSSVIPYVCDQLAMARLPRATFALLLALLPATGVLVGTVVLHQVPTPLELAGVGLVIAGVAVHRECPATVTLSRADTAALSPGSVER